MKKFTVTYWISTILIFLFEGVLPAMTFQTELAKQGIVHLGYPAYFGNFLVACKVAGAIVLIVPVFSARLKEWAYAGFTFNFIAASYSHFAVDGFTFQGVFPLICLVVLIVSNRNYYKRMELTGNTRADNFIRPMPATS